ncbi:MAG: cryptochrome/photolyase family protein [Hyphomicrobium sp.]
MTSTHPVILWFRNDLRLADHAALQAALHSGAPIIPLYILDDATPDAVALGGASRWWLHHSLTSLAAALSERGSRLILRRGDPRDVLAKLVAETGATTIYFTRAYEPHARALEQDLKVQFDAAGVAFKRYGGVLLREPEEIRTKAGDVFKVYTPFWRALSQDFAVKKPVAAPARIASPDGAIASDALAAWGLTPRKPDWSKGMQAAWSPGEAGAQARLKTFLKSAIKDYAEHRNRPDLEGVSRLSPHLHFGEISPAACWFAAREAAARRPEIDKGVETFLKELVWREFSYTLLFYWPTLPEKPFRPEFAAFPWAANAAHLKAWQTGQTGYPIVDAGMRELWTTGYMHNRVRMIVASFLIKDLLIPWQDGEAWFWDTLVDADLASNAASWQWVAGSGADAAPYFRVFNPVTQGQKFDPDGAYVRRYVPELAKLATEYVHAPFEAPASALAAAGITLGKQYPMPIVDHAVARIRALAAFDEIKKSATA